MAKTRPKSSAASQRDGDSRPEVRPESRKQWRAWLQKHHRSASGVWLFFAKKHTGRPCPSYNDAVEEALCFGWIDGLMNPVNDTHYKQLFTPRKPKSAWAESNKTRVARLIEQGLMTEAGLAAIDAAKADGSWSRLDRRGKGRTLLASTRSWCSSWTSDPQSIAWLASWSTGVHGLWQKRSSSSSARMS